MPAGSHWDATNKNFGIGVAAPTQSLDVLGVKLTGSVTAVSFRPSPALEPG
jgi:hypothetical protein